MIEIKKESIAKKGYKQDYRLYINEETFEVGEIIENIDVKNNPYRNEVQFFNIKVSYKNIGRKLLEELDFYKKTRPDCLGKIKNLEINGILEWLDSKYFSSLLSIYFIAKSDVSIRCLKCLKDNFIDEAYCYCGFELDEYPHQKQLLVISPGLFNTHPQSINTTSNEHGGGFSLELTFGIRLNSFDWNLSFSMSEYKRKFGELWELNSHKYFVSKPPTIAFEKDLEVVCCIGGYERFVEQINIINDFIKICHDETIEILSKEVKNSVLASFQFPEELKVPCEQYLLYFAQFLRDLGINATPNLKEEAGKVLFSITPTDDIEALDKIREALVIYLSLSSNPIPNSTGDRTVDMILSGARANAKHLESQLELAIAKLQFKEATIELKDATIERTQLALRQRNETIKELQEILSKGNIFEESLEKVVINGEVVDETSLYRFSREDDIEAEAIPILDENSEETRIGLVKFHEVTKLKDYGVSLDLPKAIRDLIDYFKRDTKK